MGEFSELDNCAPRGGGGVGGGGADRKEQRTACCEEPGDAQEILEIDTQQHQQPLEGKVDC